MAGDAKINELIQKYSKRYTMFKDIGPKFELTCIHIFAQQQGLDFVLSGKESTEVDLREFSPGGSNDKVIDGVLFDEDKTEVTVIQAKYRSRKEPVKMKENAQIFFNNLSAWAHDQRGRANKSVERLLDDCDFDPERQVVTLNFCTNLNIGGSEFDDLRQIAFDAEESHRARGFKIICNVYGGNDLIDQDVNFRRERTDEAVEDQSLTLSKDKFFKFSADDHDVIVAAVKASYINSLYCNQSNGLALFATNIRVGLGSGQINDAILKTLLSEPGRFFLYNNGLTITCKGIEDLTGNEYRLVKPQVVNGAQTVMSIVKAFKRKEKPLDAWVLVRVINTSDKYDSELSTLITRYQNRQNSLKDFDFRSNDPIQLWLSGPGTKKINALKMFEKDRLHIFYEHKRGLANTDSRKGDVKIPLDKLGHLRYAFLYGPIAVFTRPKAFWTINPDNKDDSALYRMAFGRMTEDGLYEEIDQYSDEEVAQIAWSILVNRRIVARVATYRSMGESSSSDEVRIASEIKAANLRSLSRWVMALASHGLRNHILEADEMTFVDIMFSEKLFDWSWDNFVERAEDITFDLLQVRIAKKDARPSVNLTKSEKDWESACGTMMQHVVKLLALSHGRK
jgi:hypothetical protein